MDAVDDLVTPIREFLDRRLPPERHREALAGRDPGLLTELRELGWADLSRPEADGGLGVPLAQLRGLAELVGERLVPGPLVEQLVLPACLGLVRGNGRRNGDFRAQALADPGVTLGWRGEIGGFSLTGDRLTGTLELVRHAAQAEALVLVAEGPGGPVLVALPAGDPALTITSLRSDDPAAHYARVTVADRAVAPGEVLATGAGAAALLVRIRAWLRLFTACELAGVARRVLADSVAYAGQREQFGRPIGAFQAVKHLLAGMAQASLSLDALCAAAADDAAEAEARGDLAALEAHGWAAKAFAARSARAVAEDGLQVHGGIGFTTEYDLHHYLRRALALRSWYGDERELTPLLGARRLGRSA
ncbi:acyl-CoA dehydrogenase family protein [Pseudonocardia acidicola]|uniref:Acyl-CoA/acyl-ACP dehydrogenase n=1 Tax=Pseudonocardia acidicola TaxID=2724939 RepID=A0ABX1S4U8_9PSEU|nr:acyl-CoA dehydrogenase family protein [Pseudonocardia acidicola]NMH95939.1 acyl-CoA/acyl-ACP dehydrogenase [Pseudonocardia acidicola]